MNKRGITIIVTVMIAVTFIVLALALVPVLNNTNLGIRGENNTLVQSWDVSDANVSTGLNCQSNSSDFDEAACIVSDLYTPSFLAIILGLAGLIIGAKVVFSQ